MTRYAKAIVAVLSAVLVAVLTQFPESSAVQQWGPIVAAFLGAVGVYFAPPAIPPSTPTPLTPPTSLTPGA